MLPLIIDEKKQYINGIGLGYRPLLSENAIATPFQIAKGSVLKIGYNPSYKAIAVLANNNQTISLKVNGIAIQNTYGDSNTGQLSNGVYTANAGYASFHFGLQNKQLTTGDEITVGNYTNEIYLQLVIPGETPYIFNVSGSTFSITKYVGVTPTVMYTSSISTINDANPLRIKIQPSYIDIFRGVTLIAQIALTYKVRLLNEAGTAVDANAGTITKDGANYTSTVLTADSELIYKVGEIGSYIIEFENQLGQKILQKIIIVDTASGGGTISPVLSNVLSFSGSGSDSPASFWNQYKTYFLIGGVFLGLSLLGAFLINRFSK